MDAVHKFSDHVIDFAERLSDIADAAEGRGRRGSSSGARWLLLPAAGAGLYALIRSDFFARQAKGVVDEAKTRAADLPGDLMNAVRDTADAPANGNGTGTTRRRKSTSASARSSTRKSTSARSSKSGRCGNAPPSKPQGG